MFISSSKQSFLLGPTASANNLKLQKKTYSNDKNENKKKLVQNHEMKAELLGGGESKRNFK